MIKGIFTVIFTVLISQTALAAPGKSYDTVRKIGKKDFCAFDEERSKWLYVKSAKNDTYKKVKKPKKNSRNFSKKNKKFRKNKKSCKRQAAPDSVDFSKIPGGEELIPELANPTVVSGTPPSYPDITDESALSLYWREVDSQNVIAGLTGGSPTANQCNEFYTGSTDDSSAGLLACQTNIDAIKALVKPLEGGIAACYLKGMAQQSVVDDGGVSIVGRGTFPSSNIENLYSPPRGSDDRVVLMQVTGLEQEQNIFVKVYAADNNATNGNNYQVDLWFCDGSLEGAPSGFDRLTVGTDNSYSATSTALRDGLISMALTGELIESGGEYQFDSTAPSAADIRVILEEQGVKLGYNVNVEDGVITLKGHERTNSGAEVTQSYSLIEYLGGSSNLAMTQGARNFRRLTNDTVVQSGAMAFEYRDTRYAAAPSNTLLTQSQTADFVSDTFYSEEPSAALDADGNTCDVTPDLTIQVDMTKESMQAVQTECESFLPKNTAFCESSEIDDATTSFEMNCGM